MVEALQQLTAGMPILVGGDRVTHVPPALAAAFRPGDALLVVPHSGELLHLSADERKAAGHAVDRAVEAFEAMGTVSDEQVGEFYEAFARALEDDATFRHIAAANAADVNRARANGRSTTRLVLGDAMRADMAAGLRAWRDAPSPRGRVISTTEHDQWRVEKVTDRLGVIGFSFEGRPNVFADACGVLRGGNTVVFRIGSDALGTARAIAEMALEPALAQAGLPRGAAALVDSPARAAGWALFSDQRLALAVARGSGEATRTLGAVARLAGVPVSLHGTGGAWIVAGPSADPEAFKAAVLASLDRKVCNTLNTCAIVASRAKTMVPLFLDALTEAGHQRGTQPKLHVESITTRQHVPTEWFARHVPISRAEGVVTEPQAEVIDAAHLGREWEWEESPEVSLVVVEDTAEAVRRFNDTSPRFVASLIASDPQEHQRFFETIDAPFVGNAMTRWVDGQYALNTPELGLANWEGGRLFGRGGILSGEDVYTVRTRAVMTDPSIHR